MLGYSEFHSGRSKNNVSCSLSPAISEMVLHRQNYVSEHMRTSLVHTGRKCGEGKRDDMEFEVEDKC